MKELLKYFKKNIYARMIELKNASFQTRDVATLLEEGKICKIKPGLYRLEELPEEEINFSFLDICKAIPRGVICLVSALEFFDLTTFNPSKIHIAVPQPEKLPKILYPPIKGYFFSNNNYSSGIEIIKTPYGEIRIYNKEKTVADMFRYRKKLGEDLALEGLKNYLKLKGCSVYKLRKYSKICRVESVIFPYIKAMVV